MTSTAIQPAAPSIEGLEDVLLSGDLGSLNAYQRVAYYQRVCESVGLNPLTQPFEYLKLNGRTILYARRAASEQLRKMHGVSITIVDKEVVEGCLMVTARATLPSGRTDEDVGSVPIAGLKGENLANATMKAITKAKRRVTLGICGLAFLDETETEGLRGAEPVPMPQLAPVVPLREESFPAGDETLEPVERQTVAAMLGDKLRAARTQAAMVGWLREVIGHDFDQGVRQTLWRMFRHQCVALKFDANVLAREAQQEVARG